MQIVLVIITLAVTSAKAHNRAALIRPRRSELTNQFFTDTHTHTHASSLINNSRYL